MIDLQDLARFASTLGKDADDAGYLACFDYTGEGRVGRLDDLAQLLRRLGTRL